MKEISANINIVGGGLIGAITAHSLSILGLKINILEKKDTFKISLHNDERTVAISEGTKNFLDRINLWAEIKKFSQPIKKINVIDRRLSNKLEFNNERRVSNLGYIVKNKIILDILYKKLKKNKRVSIINNAKILNFETRQDFIITNLENYKIVSNLNIAADGKNSYVKNIYKTPVFKKNYNKSALVLTFSHSKSHNDTAFEFFYKNGPLAILPMQKLKNNNMSSLIWTNKKDYLNSLLELEDSYIKLILKQETQGCIGNINKIFTKQIFPLTAHLNTKFYENRIIYIGDAAHSFHPIAGQGWNLGMKDLENLFNLVKTYQSLGLDPGNKKFCKTYHDDNFYNAFRLYHLTDKLDGIFQLQNAIFTFSRNIGINFLQKNRKINDMISDFAMGIN